MVQSVLGEPFGVAALHHGVVSGLGQEPQALVDGELEAAVRAVVPHDVHGEDRDVARAAGVERRKVVQMCQAPRYVRAVM